MILTPLLAVDCLLNLMRIIHFWYREWLLSPHETNFG